MPPLPVVSGAECVRALRRLGYVVARQKGSHVRLTCAGRSPTTVPLHAELAKGTLRAILHDAKIDVATFVALLDR